MSLITLEQYKTITGTSSTDNDVVLEAYLLPAVSDAIESYCRRKFAEDSYITWKQTGQYGGISGLNAPIQALYGVYGIAGVIKLANTNNYPVNVIVGEESLTVADAVGDRYVFNYDNYGSEKLNDLIDAINTASIGITATLEQDMPNYKCAYLRPYNYSISKNSSVTIDGPSDSIDAECPTWDRIDTHIAHSWVVVSYSGGYTTLPYDLQVSIANMTRDLLNMQLSGTTAKYKSESQGQYSYSLADNVVPSEIITPYIMTLDRYKIVHY